MIFDGFYHRMLFSVFNPIFKSIPEIVPKTSIDFNISGCIFYPNRHRKRVLLKKPWCQNANKDQYFSLERF